MAWQVYIRPEAEADMAVTYRFYQECRPGLGADFLLEADAAIRSIALQPAQYPRVHGDIRRALLHRFPYCVFYAGAADQVIVLAVLHAARDPAEWQGRT